jgi:hypothetical protein
MTSAEQVGETYAPPLRPAQGARGIAALARRSLTCRHVVIAGSAIFLLSNALIAPGLTPPAGAMVLIGCAASLWIVARATAGDQAGLLAARIAPRTLVLCCGLALALCVLGGEGHVFFANYDWLNRDAVLADLVRQRFPVSYEYEGSAFILRAPLGMYLIPAAVGKLLGLHAAHLALLMQNATILALTLVLVGAAAPGRRLVFLAVFVTFTGVEIVGSFINAAAKGPGTSWWALHAHQHLAWWNPLFQYTNHLTQLFWVPNHALPGWWLAALTVFHVRRELDSAALIVAFASLLFWSPLTMAGALPIVGWLVLRRDFNELPTPRILVAVTAALCFLPIAAYLAADAASVPHLWLFTWDGFWTVYVIFIAIQIPQAAVVALCWRRLEPDLRTLAILSIGMLLIIPMYRLGAHNDFSMRASIVPLALLAFVFASIVARLRLRDGASIVAAVAVILALGSFTPALEIQRAVTMRAFAISDCNVLTEWRLLEPDTWLANYFARADRMPAWLLGRGSGGPPAVIEDRECWPDHPYRTLNLPAAAWQGTDRW